MNLVDSSGWIEYFGDGANAGAFASPIQEPEKLVSPTVVLYEVFRFVLRRRGKRDAIVARALIHTGRVVPLDSDLAISAAELGQRHGLALADSIVFATAQREGATIWTQDRDFEDLPGVRYFPHR